MQHGHVRSSLAFIQSDLVPSAVPAGPELWREDLEKKILFFLAHHPTENKHKQVARSDLILMKCYAKSQRGVACLPVTALHTIQLDDSVVLLSNEGSSLSARLLNGNSLVSHWRIFRTQTIHGITSFPSDRNELVSTLHLVIWGGRSICHCILTVDNRNRHPESKWFLEIVKSIVVDDWILTVNIHKKLSSAVFLTAHNALWSISLNNSCTSSPVLLGQGLSTLLYSGTVSVSSDNHIQVASGTVFGEVILWTCSSSELNAAWVSSTNTVFLGHRGSVFGVAISDIVSHNGTNHQLLASCSDDRTIRIWNVSIHELEEHRPDQVALHVHDTGFPSGRDQLKELTTAWGHSSRIWGVAFSSSKNGLESAFSLLSRGEDGVCQLWHLDLNTIGEDRDGVGHLLKAMDSDRHHVGKNVWSLRVHVHENQSTVFTGGADGQIISRSFQMSDVSVPGSISFHDMLGDLDDCSGKSLRQYLTFHDRTIVATTEKGDLVRLDSLNAKRKHVILRSTRNRPATLCSNTAGDVAFCCLTDGSLCAYDTRSKVLSGSICTLPSQAAWLQIAHHEGHDLKQSFYLLANLQKGRQPILIVIAKEGDTLDANARNILLPPNFAVTASFYHPQQRMLILGSRSGALATLLLTADKTPEFGESGIFRHIHGADSVTSISSLSTDFDTQSSDAMYILTSGRDGTFAVHQLQRYGASVELVTLHRAHPPFGLDIEGAYIRSSAENGQNLVLYGFKSKDFVVWDETQQMQLMSVDCGGGHRSWNYCPTDEGGGMFVWTKAGTFNFSFKPVPTHQIVQLGGHGREIKALALSHSSHIIKTTRHHFKSCRLLATGAEDTDIRLFAYSSDSLLPIAILKQHKTGLQALMFSRCGRYLFSSGGVEEFVVWRLSEIPLVGIGAVMVGMISKDDEDDDARIMEFDVLERRSVAGTEPTATVVMAYSNGKAKVFEFNNVTNDSKLQLIQQLNIGTLCLTQVQMLTQAKSCGILIGATDGCLRFTDLSVEKQTITMHKVHQSNIAGMTVLELGSQTFFVATGSDDNALGLTTLRIHDEQVTFETVIVPNAHAAALTAVEILQPKINSSNVSAFVVTAGNDQILKVWRIWKSSPINLEKSEVRACRGISSQPHDLIVEKVKEHPTDVADISSMQLLERESDDTGGMFRFEAVVAGVGMQSIHFDLHVED